jgi:hypothetical protein
MPNAIPSNCGVEAWYESPVKLSTGRSMNKGNMRRKKTAESDNVAFISIADMDIEFIILKLSWIKFTKPFILAGCL